MSSEYIFEARGLNKHFGPTHANKDIDFFLKPGEVRGLAGENGSGKSTLLSQIAGIYSSDTGTMKKNGETYEPISPLYAQQHGVSIVVQELGCIGDLPAGVNVFLGRTSNFAKFGIINMRKIFQEANAILEKWGMPQVPLGKNAKHMNVEIRKIVEIARALSTDPDILILDEVTQALAQDNRKKLHALIENFKSMGRSVILITHDLEEMMEICDTISILRDGELIETVESKTLDEDSLKSKMVGRSLEGEYYRSDKEATRGDKKILSVEGISTASGLQDVSFDVYAGEIVGLAGLSDAGIHEVGKAVYGLDHLTAGKVTLVQDNFEIKQANQAWTHRVGYVPKDRDNEALMLHASIRENFSMSSVPEMRGSLGFLSNKKLDQVSTDAREQFMVKSVGIRQEIDALSGGNKQKVNMGRWLLKDLQLFVVDCPTRGVDVGVKAYLYQCLKDAKEAGLAILLITDELPEAIGMSDRILVMKNGKITGEVSRSDGLSEEAIVQVMI